MVSAPSGELSSTPTSDLSSKPPAAVPSEPSKQSVSPSPEHLWCSQHSRREVSNYGSSEARPLHERALAIRETALGPEHPNTATSFDNLASRWIAGPWIRSALPMSGANRPGPGRGRAEPLNLAGVQHGRERAIPSSYRACSTCSRNRM
ncbi:MAG: tetratricopeptide repeat protein [Methylocella sp.]